MQPVLHVNFLAVLSCLMIAMFLGFLWFGPLFGKVWAKEMGIKYDDKMNNKPMTKSLMIYALSSFLIIWVLSYSLDVWRPSVWNAGTDVEAYVYAVKGAFWIWLGYFLPLQLGRVAWEQKSCKLVLINGSFDFLRLLIFALVLSYWK